MRVLRGFRLILKSLRIPLSLSILFSKETATAEEIEMTRERLEKDCFSSVLDRRQACKDQNELTESMAIQGCGVGLFWFYALSARVLGVGARESVGLAFKRLLTIRRGGLKGSLFFYICGLTMILDYYQLLDHYYVSYIMAWLLIREKHSQSSMSQSN